jgi:hypothetical protein
MDDPAEDVSSPGDLRNGAVRGWPRRVGWPKFERAVGPLPVVVTDVDAEGALELTAVEDQQSVEALAADAADPALHVRVRVRRADRGPDDMHTLITEAGIKHTAAPDRGSASAAFLRSQ